MQCTECGVHLCPQCIEDHDYGGCWAEDGGGGGSSNQTAAALADDDATDATDDAARRPAPCVDDATRHPASAARLRIRGKQPRCNECFGDTTKRVRGHRVWYKGRICNRCYQRKSNSVVG